MIAVNPYGDKRVGVLGLGRSGLVAARALAAAGATVAVWDDNAARRQDAEKEGLPLGDPAVEDWSRHAALVLSPGIPLTHPKPHTAVATARSAGVPVIGDIELFEAARAALPAASLVAISGTNGKSTTTALVGHVLARCGIASEAAGNIGRPVLALDALAEGGVYVLEMSSYQIDLTPSLKPQIAVLLNITPDHLDRHGGMAGYVAVKRSIFANQGAGDVAVIGIDDPHCAAIYRDLTETGAATVIPISAGEVVPGGVYVTNGMLIDATGGAPRPVGRMADAAHLKGAHNWQNATAAYAVARRFIDDPARIFQAIVDFPGLAHRMEFVGEAAQVVFINDSKATNQASAARALSSFERIYWIAGGIAKEDQLDAICPHIGRMAGAYLIGRDAPVFEAALEGRLPVALCGGLADAVARAGDDARAQGGGVVLLSPAAASQDQFRDYEERGDRFRAAAEAWMREQGDR